MKVNLNDDEAKARKKLNNYCEYNSSFSFLKQHNGFRRGKIHVFLGNTGSGKSTMMKSLIIDQLENNKKVFLFLSEESIDDFKTELSFVNYDKSIFENLRVVSELNFDGKFGEKIRAEFLSEKPDLFIFDNLTTSRYYNDKTVKEQGLFATYLKKLCVDYNIPFVLVAHTSSTGGNRKMINETNIRGSKTIANLAEFFYTIEKHYFQDKKDKNAEGVNVQGQKLFQFVRVIKHRTQIMNNVVFALKFNSEMKTIDIDLPLTFEQFEQLYKITQGNFS
jgi:ABC-type sugar transport system ATPase subunit